MGSYTGNNLLFSPTTSLPDDSDPLDASEFNVAFEQLSDKTAYLGFRALGLPAQNWLDGILIWSSAPLINYVPAAVNALPTWDSTYGQWLLGAKDSTGTYFVMSSKDGYSWDALGGAGAGASGNYRSFGANTATSDSIGPRFATIVRPIDGLVSIIGGHMGAIFNQATQTYSHNTYISSILSQGAYYGIWMGGLANLFLAFNSYQSGASIDSPPMWSSDGYTWSNAAAWAPAAGFSANPYALVYSSNGPTPTVFAFSGTVGYTQFQATTDGKNWSAVAMPALLAGEQVVGAAWDQALQARNGGVLGGLVFLVSSSSQARLFNANVILSIIPHQCVGLASNNGELVTMAAFGTTRIAGTLTTLWRTLQSLDFGNSWQLANLTTASQLPSSTASGYNIFNLVGSGGQLLYTNLATTFARTMVSGQLPALPF